MSQPAGAQIEVQKVLQRAYAHVSDLTLRVDQLEILVEDQAAEIVQLRAALATVGPPAEGAATDPSATGSSATGTSTPDAAATGA